MGKQITVKRTAYFTDPYNGQITQRTKSFSQTLAYWNKTEHGEVKDKSQIYAELCVEANQWEHAIIAKMNTKPSEEDTGLGWRE